jgi:hypothetical protein
MHGIEVIDVYDKSDADNRSKCGSKGGKMIDLNSADYAFVFDKLQEFFDKIEV